MRGGERAGERSAAEPASARPAGGAATTHSGGRRRRLATPLARVVALCAVLAAGLHTVAVAWTWWSWGPGARATWLVWLDLPVSLLYLHVVGDWLLPWSLVAGGLQWALTGGLLAWLVGRAAVRRA